MAAEVDTSLPTENMPLSQPSIYSATNVIETPSTTERAFNSPPTPNNNESSTGFRIPAFITKPIEGVLAAIGGLTASSSSLLGVSGDLATSRARPWLEFFDLSAFKLVEEGGFKAYIDRLRINGPYFIFNYVILGLLLSIISVITKPVAIVGVVALVWIYFQFFGSETGEHDFKFFGFSFNHAQKVGAMVILALIVFWVTAGGLEIFFSILTATTIVGIGHAVFRKPSNNAIPVTSAV